MVSTVLTNPSGAGGHASHHFHPLPPPSSHSSVRSLNDSLVRPWWADRLSRRGGGRGGGGLPSSLSSVQSLSEYQDKGGIGGGIGGGIAVLLLAPSSPSSARCKRSVSTTPSGLGGGVSSRVSFFNCYASNIFIEIPPLLINQPFQVPIFHLSSNRLSSVVSSGVFHNN